MLFVCPFVCSFISGRQDASQTIDRMVYLHNIDYKAMMLLGCGLFISSFTFLTEHLCSLVEHRLLQVNKDVDEISQITILTPLYTAGCTQNSGAAEDYSGLD